MTSFHVQDAAVIALQMRSIESQLYGNVLQPSNVEDESSLDSESSEDDEPTDGRHRYELFSPGARQKYPEESEAGYDGEEMNLEEDVEAADNGITFADGRRLERTGGE